MDAAHGHRSCRRPLRHDPHLGRRPAGGRTGPAFRHADVRLRRRQDRPSGSPTCAPSTSSATRRRPARTWRSSTWSRRHGVLVDAVSAGEIRRALAAGYAPAGDPPPIVYTADIFDARGARPVRRAASIHVNCGSPDMIDQLGARAPGGDDHAADQSRLRPRPQPEDEHRRRAVEARHLARRDRRLPGRWPTGMAWRSPGLHMHIGSGTDLEHLSQVCGAMEKAARRSRRRR